MELFYAIFYIPIYNLLVFFYGLYPAAGMGLAIIIVTILIKGCFVPIYIQVFERSATNE